jgi:hypothetical protein
MGRRRGKQSAGGLWVPVQIIARMTRASANEGAMICCLCRLEFKAYKKLEPLILSNDAVEQFGISRRLKKQILGKLAARRILDFTQAGLTAPKVMVKPNLWR